MYSTYFKSAIAATLFASANAHFFISSPVPIPGNAIKDPLDPSGSNFPCHGADVSQGTVTPLTAGSTFNLKYELGGGANTAVHGGGSCQISLAYTTDATKLKDPANWGVIASFVGGCPTDAKGNLVTADMCTGSNGPQCVNALNFKVPAEVTNGDAVLAWTWFNNVGNREMYMNCAKVSVSGGSGSGKFPALFVANLASVNKCTTTESTNLDFPNPGTQVTVESPLNFPKQAPGGTCPAGSGSGNTTPASSAGSGTGSYTAPAAGAPAASASGPAASSPVAPTSSSANDGQYTGIGAATKSPTAPKATNSAAGNPGGIFAPGASPAVASDAAPTATSVVATTFVTAASPAAATQAAATPAAPAPAAASPASSPAASGSCQTGQVSCTASGFYCIDATTFGMCAFGCATPKKMSAGTDCSSGAVVHSVAHQKRRKQIRNVHRRFADGSF